MATITMLATRITAFAIHGFIFDDSSPVTTYGDCRCPANEKEISHGRGALANTLSLSCNGAVGFIDWLGAFVISVWR